MFTVQKMRKTGCWSIPPRLNPRLIYRPPSKLRRRFNSSCSVSISASSLGTLKNTRKKESKEPTRTNQGCHPKWVLCIRHDPSRSSNISRGKSFVTRATRLLFRRPAFQNITNNASKIVKILKTSKTSKTFHEIPCPHPWNHTFCHWPHTFSSYMFHCICRKKNTTTFQQIPNIPTNTMVNKNM